MKLNLGVYAKVITAVVGQAIAYATLYWGSGPNAKYVTIAVAVASALGVYAVPNQGPNVPKEPSPHPPAEPTGM